jgi:hypothetical protein
LAKKANLNSMQADELNKHLHSVEDNLKKEKSAAEAADLRVERAEADIVRIKNHMKEKQ